MSYLMKPAHQPGVGELPQLLRTKKGKLPTKRARARILRKLARKERGA